jgi:Predicted membrane protein
MKFPWSKTPLIPAAEQERVVACIREAELKTTGELRIYVESHCSYLDPMDRAWEIFLQLGMINTEKRNAVLIYMAVTDHQFAIVGDKHIYELAGGPTFWENAAHELRQYLKNGQIGEGLCVCVNELGKAMAQHFPYDPAITKNELPDEIVFGK